MVTTESIIQTLIAIGYCIGVFLIGIYHKNNKEASKQCQTESVIPTMVSIDFFVAMVIILIITIFYSVIKSKKIGVCDILKQYSIYASIIVYFSDTTSDFAAIIQFYIIATTFTVEQ
eukprot:153540_1